MARKRYVIIGDGAAGLSAAQKLRRADPSASIGVFSDDPHPAYYRAALTNYLLGELRDDQLWAVTPDYYEAFSIRRISCRVVALDAARSELWDSASGAPLSYDALLVATGARPRAPSFQGVHLPGVMTLRTLQDARKVVDFLRLGGLKNAVVLGSGALGLEWAHALLEHGVKVTLIERAQRILPAALDEVASDLLAARLRNAGIETILGDEVAAAHPGPQGTVSAVTLKSGRVIYCELVAAALGVVPNAEFLGNSGIALTERGAVKVDRQLRTSVANVFAAGDVASVDGEQLLLWEPARHQGRVAGENMSGRSVEYRPGVHYFATRLFDLDFARLGKIDPGAGRESIVDFPRGTGTIAYRKLVLEGGRLVGALMIGERSAKVRGIGRAMKRLIDTGVDVSRIKGDLLDPGFDFDGFLHTERLLEKPVTRAPAASAPAAKVRGTQLVALGAGTALVDSALIAGLKNAGSGAGTALIAAAAQHALAKAASGGTSLLPSQPSGTSVIPSQSGTSLLPSSAVLTQAIPSAHRGTRVLSIGLSAEAPRPAPLTDRPLDARLEALGRSFSIAGSSFSIGRSPDCDLALADPEASSVHAQIVRYSDALYLRDAGSSTGTLVNGSLATTAHKLLDGDKLRIGRTDIVFRSSVLQGAAPGARAAETRIPHLEVRSGHGVGLCFAIGREAVLIGSSPRARVYLGDPGVAPEHARLAFDGQRYLLADLGSGLGTSLCGAWLQPGQDVPLSEGETFRVGSVDLVVTERALTLASALMRPRARLEISSGPSAGRKLELPDRAVVGSAAGATLAVAELAPQHLEIVLHGAGFWVRDLSGGRSFRSGSPLGPDFTALGDGDLLLLGAGTMLRYQEAP
jgi:NADPH-dependent 2,4-dienoyl-CoA reductase/sulfur reductase-like enzyme/pSer/pThr/pTyr-binding forkhead associated (FHA) protein